LGENNEAITFRALATLPSLGSITFVRKTSRDFVTGRGPLPAAYSLRIRRFFRVATAVFAIGGVASSLAALGDALVSGQPLTEMNGFFMMSGPTLLLIAAIYYGISFFLQRRASREQQLAERGGLLPAELISTRFRNNDEGQTVLRLECRFTRPGGELVTAKKHTTRFDLDRKSPPPPGSKLLLLYVDEKLWEVL
jgi:hypothetical protein